MVLPAAVLVLDYMQEGALQQRLPYHLGDLEPCIAWLPVLLRSCKRTEISPAGINEQVQQARHM